MATKLVFLGGGNMAEAIFAGLVTNPDYAIEVIQRNLDKATRLRQLYPQISVKSKLEHALSSRDILILAIKPQQAKLACAAVADLIQHCVIVSVMAGLTVATLSSWCRNQRIVRTMPNTPASVGKGITAIYAAPAVSQSEQQPIMAIFATIGIIQIAATENMIDKIVPITSSSIAFIYYFLEGLIANAEAEFGLSHDQATALIRQVASGSAALLEQHPEIAISQQRERVTSKKGATEQGILSLAAADLHQIIANAMHRCYQRTLELGQEYN